jgi:hypothetical protein
LCHLLRSYYLENLVQAVQCTGSKDINFAYAFQYLVSKLQHNKTFSKFFVPPSSLKSPHEYNRHLHGSTRQIFRSSTLIMEVIAADGESLKETADNADLFSLVIGRGGQVGVDLSRRELPPTVQVGIDIDYRTLCAGDMEGGM